MLSPERKNFLTASDVGGALGISEFKSAMVVMRSKVNGLLGTDIAPEVNDAMAHGNRNELRGIEYALNLYDFENTGENQKFFTKEIFGATPDGTNAIEKMVLEVKCPYKKMYRACDVPKVMPEYYAQIQIQMYVLGYEKTLFVVVSPDGLITHHIYALDYSWLGANLPELRSFWQGVLDSVAFQKDEVAKTMVEDAKMIKVKIKSLESSLDAIESKIKKTFPYGAVLGNVTVSVTKKANPVDWKRMATENNLIPELYQDGYKVVTTIRYTD